MRKHTDPGENVRKLANGIKDIKFCILTAFDGDLWPKPGDNGKIDLGHHAA